MPAFKLTRRDLLFAGLAGVAAGGGGLVLGYLGGKERERRNRSVPPRAQPFAPSVFVALDEQGGITIWVTKSEMGQGVQTALPMLLAEELDADFADVRIEQAPASPSYGNQVTGASTSVASLWDELRGAGAAARELLVAAAAEQWRVAPAECATESSMVVHRPTGRRIAYRQLVRRAAELPVPKAPRLKPPGERRLLGRNVPRLDVPAKLDGSAVFGLDVRLPGMLFAAVARSPTLGGKLVRFDDSRARKLAGVRHVVAISSGVAVVADNSWAAFNGRDALELQWDPGPHAGFSSAVLAAALSQRMKGPFQSARREGDPDAALGDAAQRQEAEYELPYLAHATMEPINCTAHVQKDRCDVWAPTQAPQEFQHAAARLTGLPPGRVSVNVTLLGGGFGRRVMDAELVEAVEIAKQVPAPVQVVWSREDDIRNDFYRPPARQRLEARLDAEGALLAYRHRIVSPSIAGTQSERALDHGSVEGARSVPYAARALAVEWASVDLPVPLGFWRSVSHSTNAFAIECFVDELAERAGKDPVALRRAWLADKPRHLAVLERAAERAGWSEPVAAGRGRGVALHASFGSYVAMVAEVSLDAERKPRVERVVAAVDCGLVVHPDTVVGQIEGGIAFGLTAALHGSIGFADGRVVQSNFHDYPLLRIDRMPAVEVELIASPEPPSGVGEIGVPPIAPAVCNALYALTKQRIRTLPISLA